MLRITPAIAILHHSGAVQLLTRIVRLLFVVLDVAKQVIFILSFTLDTEVYNLLQMASSSSRAFSG